MTVDITTVFVILVVTILLFLTDRVRVDIIALLVLLSLAWTGILTPAEAFSGISSNAVLAMIAVMVMGFGISRTGVMNRLSDFIVSRTGDSENAMRATISVSVGILSAFVQNIGAVALYLPALFGISRKSRISLSRLIMPLGFAAILGGTLTMIASGPLIILNDLMLQNGLERFSFFSVTPLGLILLATGLLYFNTLGGKLLPPDLKKEEDDYQQKLIDKWHLPSKIIRCRVKPGSPLIGMKREEVHLEEKHGVYILAINQEEETIYAPWRYTTFTGDMNLAILGDEKKFNFLAQEFGLEKLDEISKFDELDREDRAGFAKFIVPPHSPLNGKTIREIALRKNYNVEPLILIQGNQEFKSDFSDTPLRSGGILIVYGTWQHVSQLNRARDLVVLSPIRREYFSPGKSLVALLCFLGAIILALLGFNLSLALFSGAVAMTLLRVISIEEAYRAINWKTVVLIAGLIPLGLAMEKTGAARLVAENLVGLLSGTHPLLLLLAVALLTTVFSLFMSNVAATVLLVPLVISLAPLVELDPRILALFVAVCTANSFILPTHQVNAFLLSAGGYRNRDYLRTGGLMTLIFVLVAVFATYWIYL
jgi:di/tricarboxylate transporter